MSPREGGVHLVGKRVFAAQPFLNLSQFLEAFRFKRLRLGLAITERHPIPPTPTPSSTAWSITPTGSISTARACDGPANPAEMPEPVAPWTCRYAWTTRSALPTCPQQSNCSRKTSPSNRDSRLTTRLRRCQKPDSQNASRPGRHQIATVGEIISESWARSNRYTRARSSESAQ